jgi:hypothetical protein
LTARGRFDEPLHFLSGSQGTGAERCCCSPRCTIFLAVPRRLGSRNSRDLCWEDANGAVSVSYNSPTFVAERYHIEGALGGPFDAVESIVEAVLGA